MHAITTRSLWLFMCASLSAVGAGNPFAWPTPMDGRAAVSSIESEERSQSRDKPRSWGEVEALRRERGIKAVAMALGRYESVTSVEKDIIALDLVSVADRSDLAVRVSVVKKASSVSVGGMSLVTDYQIRVNETLDGNARSGEIITLRLPGGRVAFEDGSVAEISIDGFRGLEPAREYVLFLTRSPGNEGGQTRYELAWGTQGAFELTRAGNVVPLGTTQAPVPKSYLNRSGTELLAGIRAAVVSKRQLREGR